MTGNHDAPSSAGHRRRHPGRGQSDARTTNKGRQVDDASRREVRGLLGDRPRRRDLLIEHLHLLQDTFGALRMRHLVALAEHMGLAMAEVYETASFYAHFDMLDDDAADLPAITVRVCDSLSCALAGSSELMENLLDTLEGQARIVRAPCMGRCDCAPVVEVGHRHLGLATADAVTAAVLSGATEAVVPQGIAFEDYIAAGGYRLLEAFRCGARSYDELAAEATAAGLRGMGGAGFPAARKWAFVKAEQGPRYLCINADEGEPSTFKDRHYLEADPHRFLEGMLLAAGAIDAERCYIYLRDEYPGLHQRLGLEIARLEREGLVPHHYVELRRGAGAYICGEESALIESIEGKRGLPRHRPPYVAQAGLFGRPTLVHNVETVFWLREIAERGGAWFASHGRRGRTGLRSFSVSGRVREPGVKLAPAGTTARELIDEFCGGMADGHTFKGYLPGGASGGILPATMADLPLDFGTLEPHGCFIGSAAVVVLSDADDMRDVASNLMQFFADESCGQCTPCRNGTAVAVELMSREVWDTVLIEELCTAMADASICGLGQAAPNPVRSVLRYFPEDLVNATAPESEVPHG